MPVSLYLQARAPPRCDDGARGTPGGPPKRGRSEPPPAKPSPPLAAAQKPPLPPAPPEEPAPQRRCLHRALCVAVMAVTAAAVALTRSGRARGARVSEWREDGPLSRELARELDEALGTDAPTAAPTARLAAAAAGSASPSRSTAPPQPPSAPRTHSPIPSQPPSTGPPTEQLAASPTPEQATQPSAAAAPPTPTPAAVRVPPPGAGPLPQGRRRAQALAAPSARAAPAPSSADVEALPEPPLTKQPPAGAELSLAQLRRRVMRLDAPPRNVTQAAGDRFLLVGFIPQQLGSSTGMGLMHWLRAAAVLGRRAVLPSVRAAEPSYRTVIGEQRKTGKYFPMDSFWDMTQMLEPWGCVKPVRVDEWEQMARQSPAELPLVDAVLFLRPVIRGPRNEVVQCRSELVRRARSVPKQTAAWQEFVPPEGKVLDVLAGRARVGAALCADPGISAEDVRRALVPYRSVMLSTPEQQFLRVPWGQICDGIPPRAHKPELAPHWISLSKQLVAHRWGKPAAAEGYGCAHFRIEKLFRFSSKTRPISWRRRGNEVTSPQLDKCMEDARSIVAAMAKTVGGRVWLIHDLSTSYGSATEHIDNPSDKAAYHTWRQQTESYLSEVGRGFCGSDEHRGIITGVGAGSELHLAPGASAVLRGNLRACALVDAAVCRASSQIVRFGAGSWSEYISNGRTPRLQDCSMVAKAAALCRETGRCW
eukprot:TRINITY_DN70756_c0_g1_i1.p1 TRINITY_DN70756_c0_g1~~TRINITY_DN70756_c0_g1_i1.p1  ORF type:complete len:706 (+),score=114.53 TRINITY_DN70756_c0_g1_i1:79-2196(+)